MYKQEELFFKIKETLFQINKSKYSVLAFRLFLRFLKEKENFTKQDIDYLKSQIKSFKSNPDIFVPTNEQVKETLNQLNPNHKLLYQIYLLSGIRKIEGDYLIKNLNKLKIQDCGDFIKINLSYFRKTKSAFFVYLPKGLFLKFKKNISDLSLSSLDMTLKRKKLIHIKYCRKWFYSMCIELGIPEPIADFYEGRSSNTIGNNHYLSRQRLADKYYPLFLKNI